MIARQIEEMIYGTKTLTQRILTDRHSVQYAFDEQGQVFASAILKGKVTTYKVGADYAVTPKRGALSAWVNWGTSRDAKPIYVLPQSKAQIEGVKARGFVQLRIQIEAIEIGWLQDMTDEQVRREGVSDRAAYITLWESISGVNSWANNPLVARMSFAPQKQFALHDALNRKRID